MDAVFVFNILIAFGACQALFISSILMVQGNNSLPRRLVSLLLIIEGITLIERLLAETHLIESVPHLIGVSYPISFLKPPLLYLAALAIIQHKFRLRKIHLLHAIPFMGMLLVNLPFYFQHAEQKLEVVRAFLEKIPVYQSFDFWLSFSFFLYMGVYLFATIFVLKKFRTQVKNNKLANWHMRVMLLYAVFLLIHFAYFLIRPSGLLDLPLFNTISMLITTFIIQSIAYSFISKSMIFTKQQVPDLSKVDEFIKDEQRIREKFERDKIYLNDSLTLNQFASEIGLPDKICIRSHQPTIWLFFSKFVKSVSSKRSTANYEAGD